MDSPYFHQKKIRHKIKAQLLSTIGGSCRLGMVQNEDNSSWDFWDKVYNNRELRQKMEERTQCEVSMKELLKSSNLCRAEVTVTNVPRLAPSQETRIRHFLKNELKLNVSIVNINVTVKRWLLRFYRGEDALRVQRTVTGSVFRGRFLHATLREINSNLNESNSTIQVEEILPQGMPSSDQNINWGVQEWNDIQKFRLELVALLRRNSDGIPMENALSDLKMTRRRGAVPLILDLFPIGLLRLFAPQIRMIGRYLSLSDQDNIAALVRMTLAERTSRVILEDWEPIPPSEIRSDSQLMSYFDRLLSHYGPQHIKVALPFRLAVSTISPVFPRTAMEMAKRLVELSPSFIVVEDILYLSMNVRHRRILLETITPACVNEDCMEMK